MRNARCILILLPIALAACSSAPPPPPYRPVADVKALMANVMEPAADEYWDAVGTVIDETGEHQIEPQTQEEWDRVKAHAYTFTEAGNLLMMPSRAKDADNWMKLSQELIAAGERAIKAAEAKDKKAVFDTGAEVYDTCTNCHRQYNPEIVKANQR